MDWVRVWVMYYACESPHKDRIINYLSFMVNGSDPLMGEWQPDF